MYYTIIFTSIILIIAINLICSLSWTTALNLLISFALVLLPSLLFLFLVRLTPKKWFNWKIFNTSKKEIKFYEKLNIRKWKDKIPECGQLVNFKKDKLNEDCKKVEYVMKFIEETYYAELTHSSCIITSIIGFLFIPNSLKLTMGLPILLTYIFLNIPSIIIQRYNRPRLKKLYEYIKK